MKYFIPSDEDTILKLWVKNPKLVAPFSRPFYPSRFDQAECKPAHSVSELLSVTKRQQIQPR